MAARGVLEVRALAGIQKAPGCLPTTGYIAAFLEIMRVGWLIGYRILIIVPRVIYHLKPL
jgi:hypothetical protein